MPCRCEDAEFRVSLPEGAEVLADRSQECCLVVRIGDRVKKYLRGKVSAEQIEARVQIAALHPDLFAATVYHQVEHAIVQPFIDGRPATDDEVQGVYQELLRRAELRVSDLQPSNVLVPADGRPKIVDFAAGVRRELFKPGINRRGRRLVIVGGLTAAQRKELHWV